MVQLDPNYILKLLSRTQIFTDHQKADIKKKLPTLDGVKIAELVSILEKEQNILTNHHTQIGQIKLKAAEKKVKAIYNFAEKEINKEEEGIIKDLDAELEAL